MNKTRYIKRWVISVLVAVAAVFGTVGTAALTAGTSVAATALTFKYVTLSEWLNSDGTHGFHANLQIGNSAGTTPVNGWTLKFAYPGDQKIASMDNATYTQSGQNVAITSGQFSSYIPAGSGYVLNFSGTWASSDAAPVSFDFNGTTYAAQTPPPPTQPPASLV